MIFIISVIIQTVVIFFILWFCHYVFWTLANIIRLFLFYKCSLDTFTNEEKIELKIIELNQTEAVVLDPFESSPDDYWDKINHKYDLQFKRNQSDPDEILFQGRVKRRR